MSEDPDQGSDLDVEELVASMCGIPLSEFMEAATDEIDPYNLLSFYAATKMGTALEEVLDHPDFGGSEDKAAFAVAMIETLVDVAVKAGAHRHKLSAGVRGSVRKLL